MVTHFYCILSQIYTRIVILSDKKQILRSVDECIEVAFILVDKLYIIFKIAKKIEKKMRKGRV